VTVNGQTFVLTKTSGTAKRGGHAHHAAGELTAPMPGLVRAVQVAEGDAVEKGQTLVILEAMKMELKVAAPRAGKVKSLQVKPGQTVERDQILVEIE
jgi:biotin carboxyl carrier protein